MYVLLSLFPLMSLSVCSESVVGWGSVCVRCQEGYKGQHCESYDISVIEVSPTHLPQHNLLKSLHSHPHQCAGQQNCELIGQRCLQCALEVVTQRVVLGENSCNHTTCPNLNFVNTTLSDG